MIKTDSNHKSPLEWASYSDKCAMVKLLIQNGADVNGRGMNDSLPLFHAINNGCARCARVILRRNRDFGYHTISFNALLMQAITLNRCKIVRMLLSFGANIQYYNNGNTIPVNIVSRMNCSECIKTLVTHAIDVNHMMLNTTYISHTVMDSNQTILIRKKSDCSDNYSLQHKEKEEQEEENYLTKGEREIEQGINIVYFGRYLN